MLYRIFVYGRILRQLREARGLTQAEVARTVAISPAHLARLETSQRGLYLEDFVRIAEALGEKPGNLLPNDIGELGPLKPLIDRLQSVPAELLPKITAILERILVLAEDAAPGEKTKRKSKPAARRHGR